MVVGERGTLINRYSYIHSLAVNGDVINNGSILDNNGYQDEFTLYVSGNITNNGTWTNYYTHLTSGNTRSITGSQPISSYYTYFDDDFTITSSPVFGQHVDFNSHTL
ncbi:hypothetical protein, partial [Candidatus Venteria ishoeyi]|uniref:hypothetical protein n=1 Tax=Candidatus Venteria ishoeyi TaxID=1899563 RepID=UPI00255CEF46